MVDANKLYKLMLEREHGFGYDLGNGCVCFVTKRINGDWMISKLDKYDREVFRKIVSEDSNELDFKNVLSEMLIA